MESEILRHLGIVYIDLGQGAQGDECLKQALVQLGVINSIVIPSFNAQLPEYFAPDYALTRHLDQGTETKQLLIYLRRETLGIHRRLGDRAWE